MSKQKSSTHRDSRATKYTTTEDMALCEAHITVTNDIASGLTPPKGGKNWQRIIELFTAKSGGNPNKRNRHSMENRICTIKKEMRNFVCILGQIYRNRESDWSTEDIAQKARIQYTSLYRKAFQHEECYQLYKHESGFDYTKCNGNNNIEPIEHVGESNSVADPEDENLAIEPAPPTDNPLSEGNASVSRQRSPRQDSQKKAKHVEESSSTSIQSLLDASSEKLINYFKEKEVSNSARRREENDLFVLRMKENEMKREQELMTVDMSKLSSAGRAWVEIKQQEILKKHGL
ncbi:hypothetical protein MKW92_045971 [Papaver armeniacum]|nr:hypothetical protein MKW92_045971 [Papaver armeniacum]